MKRLCILLIILSFLSCNEDIYENTEAQIFSTQKKGYTISGQDIPHIVSKIKKDVSEDFVFRIELTDITSRFPNSSDELLIDVEKAQVIELTTGAKSYAFSMESEDTNIVNNYIVRQRADGYIYSFMRQIVFYDNISFENFAGEVNTYRKDGLLIEAYISNESDTFVNSFVDPSDCIHSDCPSSPNGDDSSSGGGGGGGLGGDGDDDPWDPWGDNDVQNDCASWDYSWNGDCFTIFCFDEGGTPSGSNTYCPVPPNMSNRVSDLMINAFLLCDDNCPPDCNTDDCDISEDPIIISMADLYYQCISDPDQVDCYEFCFEGNNFCFLEDQITYDCLVNNDCDMLEDVWEDENVEYNELPDCLQQLVQDLLNCDGTDIGNIVRQFDVDGLWGDNFNLIFQAIDGLQNDSEQVVHAQTVASDDWRDYFIQFDLDNNGNRTDLALYSTLAHEAIHAILLFRLYNESPNYQYDHGHLESLDYHEVFDLYVQEFPWPDGVNNTDEEEHNFMANHTVGLIANSIQEMDMNTHSREFYWNLAWGGLQHTTAWQNMADQYSIYLATGQDFEIDGLEFLIDAEQFEQINTDINGENNYGSQNTKGEKILENNGDCAN